MPEFYCHAVQNVLKVSVFFIFLTWSYLGRLLLMWPPWKRCEYQTLFTLFIVYLNGATLNITRWHKNKCTNIIKHTDTPFSTIICSTYILLFWEGSPSHLCILAACLSLFFISPKHMLPTCIALLYSMVSKVLKDTLWQY